MKRSFCISLLLAVAVSAVLQIIPAASGAEKVFRAGAHAIDVTPTKLPVRVAGSIRETWREKITDKLHARALVLDDGQTSIVIVTVDSCLMDREMLDAAKAAVRRCQELEQQLYQELSTPPATPRAEPAPKK